jgi:hypothetical protein
VAVRFSGKKVFHFLNESSILNVKPEPVRDLRRQSLCSKLNFISKFVCISCLIILQARNQCGQIGLVPSNYLLELSQFLTQDVGGSGGPETTNGKATNG